jgi:hypothetical protein
VQRIPHATVFCSGNEIEIENLKPSTTYVLRIKAKNEVGTGINAFKYNVTTEDIRKSDLCLLRTPSGSGYKQSAHALHAVFISMVTADA